ncbi:MAG: FAD-binding oxidoreductase [Devosia sp.]|nr:FAD-binding oxidoreductase [Devosia sp.]
MTGFLSDGSVRAWGRVHKYRHDLARPSFRDELPGLLAENGAADRKLLAIGLRRSYGNSGLNADGGLLDMSGLDRLISFDPETGVLEAEAGASLAEILDFALPRGYFLPVTPGTRFVTLGGAIANDVHGKNHLTAGTFGRWVREIELLRTDGSSHVLRPDENTGLFAATIGGLGLTGIITRVALELKPVSSGDMDVETIPFDSLAAFFTILREPAPGYEYDVAWVDCLAGGAALGRGLFTRARHSAQGGLDVRARRGGPSFPVDLPGFALNRFSIGAFNALYYAVGRMKAGRGRSPYGSYFYPLDSIGQWNRMYGKAGMYQYQSVVPPEAGEAATAEMLRQISKAGQGSFLVVLKSFGSLSSPGMLSFPREGITLALDFPNRGPSTLQLLDRLDAVVREAGGRLYPAKDGRLPPDMFRSGYPLLDRFAAHVDPGLSSSFWRRMQG